MTSIDRIFRNLDELFAQHAINPLSLNPHKTLITSFVELEDLIVENIWDIDLIQVFKYTLERILKAFLLNFPENIFWDFDFIISSMLRQCLTAKEGAIFFLGCFGDKVVSLMDLFGERSEIRFHYVHDFIYGFDWARWVQKDTETRSGVEPFSLFFLEYLLTRGREILQMISVDNIKYYKISSKDYRNSFHFSRQMDDERRLLMYLANHKLIPVATWEWDARPVWSKPFHEIREQISLRLNNKTNENS
jgi:hypothetical protein